MWDSCFFFPQLWKKSCSTKPVKSQDCTPFEPAHITMTKVNAENPFPALTELSCRLTGPFCSCVHKHKCRHSHATSDSLLSDSICS